eukprot:284814592_2
MFDTRLDKRNYMCCTGGGAGAIAFLGHYLTQNDCNTRRDADQQNPERKLTQKLNSRHTSKRPKKILSDPLIGSSRNASATSASILPSATALSTFFQSANCQTRSATDPQSKQMINTNAAYQRTKCIRHPGTAAVKGLNSHINGMNSFKHHKFCLVAVSRMFACSFLVAQCLLTRRSVYLRLKLQRDILHYFNMNRLANMKPTRHIAPTREQDPQYPCLKKLSGTDKRARRHEYTADASKTPPPT